MITIRWATCDDKGRLFAFNRLAYANKIDYHIPHRWEWEFERNPYALPAPAPILIAEDTDTAEFVGQNATMPVRLYLNGETREMAWGVDAFVLRQHRGNGIGTALQKKLHDSLPIFMSLNMSAVNRRIKKRLGSIELPPVVEYDKVLRYSRERIAMRLANAGAVGYASFRFRLVRGFGLDLAAASVLNIASGMTRRRWFPTSAHREKPVVVSPVTHFGAEFDDLWASVAPNFGGAVVREARYLNWKFLEQPHMEHIAGAARRTGILTGYVIVRRCRPPEPNVGIIVDMLADPMDEGTLEALVDWAVRCADAQSVDNVWAATSVPSYSAVLRRHGFVPSGQSVAMFFCGHETAVATKRASEKGWLLSRGDSDWDAYPIMEGPPNPNR